MGAAILIGWLAWSVVGALALRLVVARELRKRFRLGPVNAALLAYPIMALVFGVSLILHELILGPGSMYGATPREAFSTVAYLLAPFGLPLLVGGCLVFVGDLFHMIFQPVRRTSRP